MSNPEKNGNRLFTLGEEWGPVTCEEENCSNGDVYTILLTYEENRILPSPNGPEAANFIFENKLGKALCKDHLLSY